MRALLALLLAAETAVPATPRVRPPVFRSELEIVYVNVIVRDKDGNPVRGLRREDFVVAEDGKTQSVDTFHLEEVPVEALPAAAAAGAEAPAPLPILKPTAPLNPATADERLANKRLVVLMFDNLSPEQLGRALESARNYVDKRMSAADLVAVAAVQTGLTVHQDFTADRE
jgi:VWFA-related protein